MQEPGRRHVFAGIDSRTDTALPAWYADRVDDTDEVMTFSEAIRDLPRATTTEVAYRNPVSDEWVETERFNAVAEPSRLRQQATGGGGKNVADGSGSESVDPLFHVPSDSYTILNPVEVYAPLERVLREQTVDGRRLAEVAFGEIRQYRGGGEVHMDVLFDGLEVTLSDRRDPITMGVTSGYDFFGGHAVYVEGFARDTACANSIRSLTNKEVVRHVGGVEAFDDWWEEILGQLDLVADDLAGFIDAAQGVTLEFTDLPFDVVGFYDLLDFPQYLAEQAASDVRANAVNPFEIDMWTLHSGATYALTHHFRGKEGTSLDGYQRVANDVLFNPEATIDRVQQAYEQQTEEVEQEGLTSGRGQARIEQVGDDLRDAVEQFESREEALRERFTQVSN
ncbi:hypothetical protein ACFPYI_08655 [Halomarina salina]|uniref:Uncharacterized protein n=1 Tax=Halomarina salina TaxID=1872699 RepID=A0ABD5RL78_9EURY|nr:hypothetical protein [Halomarina salina]